MLYAIWVVGVLFAIWASVKCTINKEKKGKFEE